MDEELSGHGDEGNFYSFSIGAQTEVKGFKCRVAASGGDGGHVKGATDFGAPALDKALFAGGTAVSVIRGQTRQGADLLSTDATQLRQLR